jgi:hypothetical protein
MAIDVINNLAQTSVTSGGTTAPSAGTVETWTVNASAPFVNPASSGASPPTQFRVVDIANPAEIMLVTNQSGSGSNTWTVTRGAEGTTPFAHASGWICQAVMTAGALDGRYLNLVGSSAMLAALAMGGAKITGGAPGVATTDFALMEQLDGVTTVSSTGNFTPTVSGTYLVIAIGGGGSGGGAGSATGTTLQVGGGGGGSGETKMQLQSLVAATAYTCTIGAGGTAPNGGASGGHAGTAGNPGGTTTFAGTTSLLAAGGSGGVQSASNSTAAVAGGGYGYGASGGLAGFTVGNTPNPGCGGPSSSFGGAIGGASLGLGAPGGGGGGVASSTLGGGGGAAGAYTAAGGGVGGGIGSSGTAAGVAGVSATAGQYGAGGGGGGGGAAGTGAGGSGGAGAAGAVIIIGPLI